MFLCKYPVTVKSYRLDKKGNVVSQNVQCHEFNDLQSSKQFVEKTRDCVWNGSIPKGLKVTTKECFMYIGFHLLDINDGRLYDTVYHKNSGDYCKTIYQYAEQELDIKKSTTYELMAVASVFHAPGTPRAGLDRAYVDYSYSQLVELSTVPKEFHQYCDPHLTIKQIREWKQGKKVTASFGVSKDNPDSESSVFGLCRDFQIPPDRYIVEYGNKNPDTPAAISFRTSGMENAISDCESHSDAHVLEISDSVDARPALVSNIPDNNINNFARCFDLLEGVWLSLNQLYRQIPSEAMRICINDINAIDRLLSSQLSSNTRPVRDGSVGLHKPVADWYDMNDRTVGSIVQNLCTWFGDNILDYDQAFDLFFNALTDSRVLDSIKLFVERYLNS